MEPSGRFDTPPFDPPQRERVINAPLLPVLVALSMPVLFLAQSRSADGWRDLAFAPVDLGDSRWWTLFTSMLLHGGWTHAFMNAIGALTFGAPVARLLRGPSGVAAFLALYIVSGAVGALGYALVHIDSAVPMVGASGAVFGLIGAATRLLGARGRVLPLTDRRVITASIAWMAVNAVTGLIGFAPGVEGARIAWEAHAFGFLTGILAIGPLGRLFGESDTAFASRAGLGDPLD